MRPPVDPLSLAEAGPKNATLRALPIELAHIRESGGVSANHGDPFDRLLVIQASQERLTLATADRDMREYPVEPLWEWT